MQPLSLLQRAGALLPPGYVALLFTPLTSFELPLRRIDIALLHPYTNSGDVLTLVQCVGWSNFLGFATGPCSVNYALAAMILAAGQIAHPAYVQETWHLYLVFLLLLVIQGLLTMNATKFLGYLNIVGTIANVLVLVIFIIWLPVASINKPK